MNPCGRNDGRGCARAVRGHERSHRGRGQASPGQAAAQSLAAFGQTAPKGSDGPLEPDGRLFVREPFEVAKDDR
jgi:hypothetical protein